MSTEPKDRNFSQLTPTSRSNQMYFEIARMGVVNNLYYFPIKLSLVPVLVHHLVCAAQFGGRGHTGMGHVFTFALVEL